MPSEESSSWTTPASQNLSLLAQPIATTEKVWPSHVFVINDREIVTQLPSSVLAQPGGATENPKSVSGAILASVTILPSRIVVVDEKDSITEV